MAMGKIRQLIIDADYNGADHAVGARTRQQNKEALDDLLSKADAYDKPTKAQMVAILIDLRDAMERSDFSGATSGSQEQAYEDCAKASLNLTIDYLAYRQAN